MRLALRKLFKLSLILLPVMCFSLGFAQTDTDEPEADISVIAPIESSDAQYAIFGRDMVAQFRSLASPEGITLEISELIERGNLLLRRAEIYAEQMPTELLSETGGTANLRIMRLRNEFLIVLHGIEIERAKGYPIDQLRSIMARYEEEHRRLSEEIAEVRKSLIVKAERFIGTYHTNPLINRVANRDEIIADVMFRLGELYYREAEEIWAQEDMEYWQMVDQMPEDAELPPEPVPDYTKAVNIYRRIIDEFPNTSFVNESLYNIAVIMYDQEEDASKRQARDTFETLVDNFPDSRYVSESLYRIGYYHFENLSDMSGAIPYFEEVLNHPESEFYDDALYMLGWCNFRKKPDDPYDDAASDKNYRQAVDFFDKTVQHAFEMKEKLPPEEFTGDMSEEATKYLAICYSQEETEWTNSGIGNAVSFINDDSLRYDRYGYEMLKKMGEIYRDEIGYLDQAVDAYEQAMVEYPLEPENPWLQEKVVSLYFEDMLDEEAAHEAWNQLFHKYRRGSDWDEANHFDQVRLDADTLIAKYYYHYYNKHLKEALSLDPDKVAYALGVAENYLTEFPLSDKTPKLQYYMGVFLQQSRENLQYQANAYEAFKDVVTRWGENEYREKAAEGMISVAQALIAFEEGGAQIPDPTFIIPETQDPGYIGGAVPEGYSEYLQKLEAEEEVPAEADSPVDEKPPVEEELPVEEESLKADEETEPPVVSDELDEQPADADEQIEDTQEGVIEEEIPEELPEETPEEEVQQDVGEEVDESTDEIEDQPELPDTTNTGYFEYPEFLDDIPGAIEYLTFEDWDPLENAIASIDDPLMILAMVDQDTTESVDQTEQPPDTATVSSEEQVSRPVEEDVSPVDSTIQADTLSIVEPDSLSATEDVSAEIPAAAVTEAAKVEILPLLKSEEMLIYASDLFIENFPENKNAPTIIMQAGQVYLNKNYFDESRRYFEMIVTQYAQSEYVEEAFRGILKGYRDSGLHLLAEETTRRIETAGISGDLLNEAMTIRGESIYLHAKQKKDTGDQRQAALDFRRTALDVPDAEFADQALWESGITFMEIKDWNEAIRSFELLIHTYSESEWMPKAYYNIATIYEDQIKDPALAAATYDTLANVHPERTSERVQVALSRASVNYEEVEDWNKLLEIHENYLERFPDADDAIQWLFDMARFYLKLENEARAMRIYEDFANKYPDDPRTVQAYYEPGEYYLENDEDDRARVAFEGTLEAHRRLVSQGGAGNIKYASRAKDVLTSWKFDEFKVISYPAGERQYLNAKERKEALRNELIEDYKELRDFLMKESFLAYYRMAQLTELMAQAEWRRPRVDTTDDPEVLLPLRRALADSAMDFYFSAIADYRAAITGLSEQITLFNSIQSENQVRVDTLNAYILREQKNMSRPDLPEELKLTLEKTVSDSQKALTSINDYIKDVNEWIALGQAFRDSAAERVPEIALMNADIFATAPFLILENPLPPGRRWEKMSFRALLLNEAMLPAAKPMVEEYLRAIEAADTAIITKRSLADTSRIRIQKIYERLHNEYHQGMEWVFKDGYDFYVQGWEWMIFKEDPLAEAYGLFIDMFPDEITLFQEQAIAFGVGIQTMAAQLLELALKDTNGKAHYLDMAGNSLEYGWNLVNRFESYRDQAVNSQNKHETRFNETLLETELIGFQGYDIIISTWNETLIDVLVEAWVIPEELLLQPQPWSNQIARKLVTFDPSTYAYLLGIKETDNFLATDTTWIATIDFIDPEDIDFDITTFEAVKIGGFPDSLDWVNDYGGPDPLPIALFETMFDTTWIDTIVVDPNYIPPVESDTTDQTMIDSLGLNSDSLGLDASLSNDIADSAMVENDESVASAEADSLAEIASSDSLSAESAENDTIPPGFMLTRIESLAERREGFELVYYVYRLNVVDRLTDAELFITADNDYNLYINGEFITADDIEDSTDWKEIEENPFILEYMRQGENIIVAEVEDPDLTGGGFWMDLIYRTVPEIRDDMQVILPGQTASTESETMEMMDDIETPEADQIDLDFESGDFELPEDIPDEDESGEGESEE